MNYKHIKIEENGFITIDGNYIRSIRDIMFVSNIIERNADNGTFYYFKICLFNGFSFTISYRDLNCTKDIQKSVVEAILKN